MWAHCRRKIKITQHRDADLRTKCIVTRKKSETKEKNLRGNRTFNFAQRRERIVTGQRARCMFFQNFEYSEKAEVDAEEREIARISRSKRD